MVSQLNSTQCCFSYLYFSLSPNPSFILSVWSSSFWLCLVVPRNIPPIFPVFYVISSIFLPLFLQNGKLSLQLIFHCLTSSWKLLTSLLLHFSSNSSNLCVSYCRFFHLIKCFAFLFSSLNFTLFSSVSFYRTIYLALTFLSTACAHSRSIHLLLLAIPLFLTALFVTTFPSLDLLLLRILFYPHTFLWSLSD